MAWLTYRKTTLSVLILIILNIYLLLGFIFLTQKESGSNESFHSKKVVIGAVCCRPENQYKYNEQTIVMLKSVLISAKLYNISTIEIHLFLEHISEDGPYFQGEILEMASAINVEII